VTEERPDGPGAEPGARDVAFLYEVGSLRHVQRTWRQFGGVPYANVAEHTVRVAWIAMLIAVREGGDVARVAQLALLHDLPEVRTGDVNYLSRLYTERHETLAMADMSRDTSLEDHVAGLWRELADGATLEARITKDADALDCDLELMESDAVGTSLRRALEPTREQVAARLHTRTARLLFDQIYAADPHEWHLTARNRFTAGDWAPLPHSGDDAADGGPGASPPQ
jgi:putative hydrolase of HD superfamily